MDDTIRNTQPSHAPHIPANQQTDQAIADITQALQKNSISPQQPVSTSHGEKMPVSVSPSTEIPSTQTPEVLPHVERMQHHQPHRTMQQQHNTQLMPSAYHAQASPTTPAQQQFPMTKVQAQQMIKSHKKIDTSLLWFAMLIFRQWQMFEHEHKEVA